jgi:hypothetical protein
LDDGIDTSQGYGATEMTPLKSSAKIAIETEPKKVSWNRPYLSKEAATEEEVAQYDAYRETWRYAERLTML